jgi:hypothetical protein
MLLVFRDTNLKKSLIIFKMKIIPQKKWNTLKKGDWILLKYKADRTTKWIAKVKKIDEENKGIKVSYWYLYENVNNHYRKSGNESEFHMSDAYLLTKKELKKIKLKITLNNI